VDAPRFYQRRGFRLAALHRSATDDSRVRLKPEIPETGAHGKTLRDFFADPEAMVRLYQRDPSGSASSLEPTPQLAMSSRSHTDRRPSNAMD
jgi:hypothetical protein